MDLLKEIAPMAEMLAHYRLDRRLNDDPSGPVYLAEDVRAKKRVVLKTLPRGLPPRVAQELRAVAELSHPSIVAAYDVGESMGVGYIVVDLVKGDTIRSVVSRLGPMNPRAVRIIGVLLAEALRATHSVGIVHGDLGADNIIITEQGLKVLDFGIARLASAPAQELLAEKPERSTDLLGLGAVLYEALTGKAPFDDTGILDAPRILERIAEVDPSLGTVMRNALIGTYQSAEDLLRDLAPETLTADYALRQVAERVAVQLEHPDVSKPRKHYTVKVFCATDRNRTGRHEPHQRFGSARSRSLDPMSYAVCEVSVPYDHARGKVEHPPLWWFRWDPDRHVHLLSLTDTPRNAFFTEVRSAVGKSERHETFVFIHGYCTKFSEAVRRTAQIAYDLRFDGPPILYSWPSRGWKAAYPCDETSAKWTVPHLRTFLEDVLTRTNAERVHLVAHSMGNFILSEVLQTLRSSARFREVILTAPDIDVDIFADIFLRMRPVGERFTLYASSNDQAIRASKLFHGRARAGESGQNLVVLDGLDTDVFDVIKGEPPLKRFFLQQRQRPPHVYWEFVP